MALVIAHSGFLFLSSLIRAEGISQPVHLGILTEPGLKRSFTLVPVPPLPRRAVEMLCRSSELAHLNSRAMQLHLVTEANRTEYSHVTAWVDLDRALTRHDSLVYINGSVLTDDVTDSNSTDLLCVSVYVKTGGDVTYQADNCSLPYLYKCSGGNGSSNDGKTWFEARHQCEQYTDELESPSAAIWSSQDDATVNKTYWVAAASVDTIEAYRTWQPGQVTPSYNCVLLNLATGKWTAVSCNQTNSFVLCEVVSAVTTNSTTTVHYVTSGELDPGTTETATASMATGMTDRDYTASVGSVTAFENTSAFGSTYQDGSMTASESSISRKTSSSPTTESSANSNHTPVIAGVGAACVVITVLGIIVAVVCARREKKTEESLLDHSANVANDQQDSNSGDGAVPDQGMIEEQPAKDYYESDTSEFPNFTQTNDRSSEHATGAANDAFVDEGSPYEPFDPMYNTLPLHPENNLRASTYQMSPVQQYALPRVMMPNAAHNGERVEMRKMQSSTLPPQEDRLPSTYKEGPKGDIYGLPTRRSAVEMTDNELYVN